MTVYLRHGLEKTIVRATTLWLKMQIKLAMSSVDSILTPGPLVLASIPWRQASGRVATWVPVSKSLVWLDQERRGTIPESPALEADAVRPPRLWVQCDYYWNSFSVCNDLRAIGTCCLQKCPWFRRNSGLISMYTFLSAPRLLSL